MEHVLTLIGNPENRPLDNALVAAARTALLELRCEPAASDWLAPGVAADLPFRAPMGDSHSIAIALHRALDDFPADIAVQPAAGRRKMLLIADMESTIIANEMLDELAEFVGLRDKVADITRRAMNGELDFAAAVRARVALLKGLPASVLDDAMARVTLTPGAAELVATMRANGALTALVSGGFGFFTSRVRHALGFDLDQANEIEIAGGTLTGAVREPILDRQAKLAALERLAAERGLPLSATMAVGDGANDLPMLKAAGLGVAYHAKPVVAAEAAVRIDHGDLTALLYLQGYRASEFKR